MKKANAYKEIEKIVLPLMTDYQTDLTKHDKAEIARNPNTPFLHYSGDTGTGLIMLVGPEEYPKKGEMVPYLFGQADRHHILKQCLEMAEYYDKERYYAKRVLYFDGKVLKQIEHKKAVDIAKQYAAGIRRHWLKGV